jgi:hypothetical protein
MINDDMKTCESDGKGILKKQINHFISSADLIVDQLDPSMDLEKLNAQFRTLCFFYKMVLELELNFLVRALNQHLLPNEYTDIVPGLDSLWKACQKLISMTLPADTLCNDAVAKVGQYIIQIDTYCDALGLENPSSPDDMIQFTFFQAKSDMRMLQNQLNVCMNMLSEWESMIEIKCGVSRELDEMAIAQTRKNS